MSYVVQRAPIWDWLAYGSFVSGTQQQGRLKGGALVSRYGVLWRGAGVIIRKMRLERWTAGKLGQVGYLVCLVFHRNLVVRPVMRQWYSWHDGSHCWLGLSKAGVLYRPRRKPVHHCGPGAAGALTTDTSESLAC